MAQAIRTLTVEKGIEPRDFALVAFGGAGPMHAVFLARELGIAEVLVPRFPGAFSAWGMLETEVRKDTSRAYFAPLADVDRDDLAALLAEHEAAGLAGLADEGIAPSDRRVEHALDLRYSGQEYTLTIALESADEPRGEGFAEALSGRFHDAHRIRFGHANPGAPVEAVVVRSTALGEVGRVEPATLDDGAASPEPERRPRRLRPHGPRGGGDPPRRPRTGRRRRRSGRDQRADGHDGRAPGRRATVDAIGTLVVASGRRSETHEPSRRPDSIRSRPRSSAARSAPPRTR